MPDVAELGRKVKAKYPGQYDDLADDDVGRKVKSKYAGAYDDFTDVPPKTTPETLDLAAMGRQAARQAAPGVGENVAIGAERGYRRHLEPAAVGLVEVTEGMKTGDFGPAIQMAKEAGRGMLQSLKPPDPQFKRGASGRMESMEMRRPDPVLREAQQRREQRYQASPQGQKSRQRLTELDQRAALDPSITGKATRGTAEFITGAAPSIAAAVATRGAILPTAITAGLQSAGNPGQMVEQAAASTLPLPGINAIASRLRRRPRVTEPATMRDASPVAPPVAPSEAPVPPAGVRQPAAAPADPYGFQQAFSNLGLGDSLRNALRDSVAKNGRLPSAEKNSSIGRAYEAAVAAGAPRTVATLDQVMQGATPATARPALQQIPPADQPVTVGAEASPPQPPTRPMADPFRQTAEIPRVDATPTQRLQYSDAPETQEMPSFRARLQAENATTAELPRVITQEPTNRITQGEGAELPRQLSRPLEGQPIERSPIRAFHGTDADFDAFDFRLGEPHFTRDRVAAEQFAKGRRGKQQRIVEADVDIQNPAGPAEWRAALGRASGGNPRGMAVRDLQRQGYDGVVTDYEIIPFSPEQVKMQRQPPTNSLVGRKVTQEAQLPPGMKAKDSFASREDARQGHFERFDDDELVAEIGRLEDVQNQATRGRSRMSREELEAVRFDHKIAVEMQKERLRIQTQQGRDPGTMIAPRTPGRPQGRKIQHSTFGEVTQAPNQKGIPSGKLRVIGAEGKEHIIQNPRTRGNREATFVRSSIPDEAMPELQAPNAPPPPGVGGATAGKKVDFTIPDEAMPELRDRPRSRGTIMGSGFGSLQGLFEGKPIASQIASRMARMARTPESPVSITQLREQFPGMSKADFDAAMTKMNEEGRISLHRHDGAMQLSEDARAKLVQIGKDFFTAATIRERPGQVMGMGLGGLQGMFKGKPKAPELGRLQRRPQQQPLFEAAAKSPWQDSVLAYYRANLLTNPVSRAADLGSTVINQFADAAVRPIAAAVDVFVSKLTGKRSITGPSLRGAGRAVGSVRQGLRDAREVLRTGKQPIDSGADDALYGSEIRSGLGKGFDAPVNGVFRVLGAMDAPFRRFSFERNLADRAKTAAINEAKAGRIPRSQIKSRAAELVDRDDVINAAVIDGEKAVLADPNRISSWLAKQTANSPNARLAVGIVQPFMRIPLNAVLKSADFAGIGGVKALYKIARGGVRKARGGTFFKNIEEQRVFAQNVASGSFAPAAFLLGMELEEQGKMEGYYFTSRKDFPRGKVPTSINLGGENYDINRLGGFMLAPLFIGATYSRLRKQDASQANALLRSFSGLAQQTPGLGYYGAPAKASRILAAEEPGSEIVKEAGSITSGFIPASGASGAVAKAIDPVKKRQAEGFTGPIMNRIPGLRGQLPERQQTRNLSFTGAVAQEFRKHGLDYSRVDQIPGDTEQTHQARATKVEAWLGEYGGRLINHPRYRSLTPAQQKAAIQNLRGRIGAEANSRRPDLSQFRPNSIIRGVRNAEREKPRRERQKIVVAPD